jgi:hypothetical protein
VGARKCLMSHECYENLCSDRCFTNWRPLQNNFSQLYVFQISSSDDHKFPHGILKSPASESVVSNKQVKFLGLSSDSDVSLVSIITVAIKHFRWWYELVGQPQFNVMPSAYMKYNPYKENWTSCLVSIVSGDNIYKQVLLWKFRYSVVIMVWM